MSGRPPRLAVAPGQAGFTLVEVMVALLIFGMIAAAGVAVLRFSVLAQAATGARLDDGDALARTIGLMAADLAQAFDRPTRDEAGAAQPAFRGGRGADGTLLMLVRGGWDNPDAQPRPTLQKVAWRLNGDTVERIAWPQLDGALPLPPVAVLTRVADVRLRYRMGGAWSDDWQGLPDAPLPQAVELNLTMRDGTRSYHRLFLVGTGYRPPAVPQPTPTP